MTNQLLLVKVSEVPIVASDFGSYKTIINVRRAIVTTEVRKAFGRNISSRK